jgi:formate dehydrogenase iron-sulfur subunit
VNHVYGVEEAGGTSVLMLSSVPFESIGMKTDVPKQPLPMLTWQVLSRIPDFVVLFGAFLFGIHWITSRREQVAAHEAAETGRAVPPEVTPVREAVPVGVDEEGGA